MLTVEQARLVCSQLGPLDAPVRLAVWNRLQAALITDDQCGLVRTPARLLAGWVIEADTDAAARRRKDAEAEGSVDYRRREDGLVDLFATGLSGPNAQAVLSRIRSHSAPADNYVTRFTPYAAPTRDEGGVVGDLEVDLNGLEGLAGALGRIADRLERARGELRGAVDALGDDDVVDGLERFEDRWRDGRQQVCENAQTLGTMLTESVRTYRQTDVELASSLTTSTTSAVR